MRFLDCLVTALIVVLLLAAVVWLVGIIERLACAVCAIP